VDSLEAALWCFLRTDTFEQATLVAANLGDDADTTAATCGQVAGAYYGATGIPSRWIEKLALRAQINELAEQLSNGCTGNRAVKKTGWKQPSAIGIGKKP
jgi:ADP-ribosyl-[dinitrogen reductase] hydrolase